MTIDPTDPRKAGGDIAGPSEPHGRNDAVVNTEYAVLLDAVEVVQVESNTGGEPVAGLALHGRINRTQERADILFLMDGDGMAAIASELVGLAARSPSRELGDTFAERFEQRLAQLP